MPAGATVRQGRVEAFDEAAGLGTVFGDDGSTYEFHCVEIVGGGRTIPVGGAVVFAVWNKLGRREAFGIIELDDP